MTTGRRTNSVLTIVSQERRRRRRHFTGTEQAARESGIASKKMEGFMSAMDQVGAGTSRHFANQMVTSNGKLNEHFFFEESRRRRTGAELICSVYVYRMREVYTPKPLI
eukprot:153662-Prorocentrum_minimum.AAC.1